MRKLSLTAPAATIFLAFIFLYFNPYNSETPIDRTTEFAVHLMLTLPAAIAIFAYVVRNRMVKRIAFFWSLPLGLYLGIAGVPSLWTLFILLIPLYLFIPTERIQRKS